MDRESKIRLGICVALAALGGFLIIGAAKQTALTHETLAAALGLFAGKDRATVPTKRLRKPPARVAKGVYLTAYSAGNAAKMAEIIDLIEATELNAVVIDIKDYSGMILYDSQIPLVVEFGTANNQIGDTAALIRQLHEHGIYVVARQSVFQDPALARQKPEWAIHTKAGDIWYDHKGLSWVDPTRVEVWDYNLAIAREAIALGFDEINFDYVRFPSDGDLSTIVYESWRGAAEAKPRHEVMRDFYQYVSDVLAAEPAWISVDMFGFVMERDDGLQVGQRVEDAVGVVDYISPMMYPSHYPSGHLGLENPAAHPALVIDNGMKKGAPKFVEKRAQLRPWLQAFNLGADYDAEKIRAQIEAVEKYPNAGWLLWNAANRYSEAGLKSETRN